MKLLYISEIVGKCGIWSVKTCLPSLKLRYKPDYVIANANSATGAGGLLAHHAGYLRKLGVDCITLGDNAFLNYSIYANPKKFHYCLRPFNLSSRVAGLGYKVFNSKNTKNNDTFINSCKKDDDKKNSACEANLSKKPKAAGSLVVVSLLGQFGRHRIFANEPFSATDEILRRFPNSPIVIDYSSFSTAEKKVLGYYLDGEVSAVIGSGCKVATSDAGFLPKGTAFITDAGRTGASVSSGGYEFDNKIREFKTGLTEYSACSWKEPQLQGVFLEIENNKVLEFERVLVKDYGNKGNNS